MPLNDLIRDTSKGGPPAEPPDLRPVESGLLLLGMSEAAERLGVCKKTIERERDAGRLACLRIGRHWKVSVRELHRFIRERECEAAKVRAAS